MQASALNEPQVFAVSHNRCLMPQKGGSIEGMPTVVIPLRYGCKFWLKRRGDTGSSSLDALSTFFVMNESALKCERKCGNEYGSNSGKGEIVFYQSKEFHAFLAGGFFGACWLGYIYYRTGWAHILRESLWHCQEVWRTRGGCLLFQCG